MSTTTPTTATTSSSKSPWVSFFSGGMAGVTAKSAIAPLERVKILYQIKSELYSINSIFGSISKIVENEGIKGLWRGNSATILRVFPYAAVQFLSYDSIRKHLITDQKSSFQSFLAGSSAGGISVIATYPLDLTRARLAIEIDRTKYNKPHQLLIKTFRAEGFKGIYRGIQPTLIGILPYGGFSFSTFEYLKKNAPAQFVDENGSINGTYKLVAGGVAGGVAQTVSYPLDTVRRRMQTHGFGDAKAEINLEHGTLRSIYNIFKNEGIFALYKGLSINYIKVIPTTSIAFYSYEFFSGILSKGI
ncbi:hypothetical protein DICPUDRAFT_85047 [Dictyostelium purpureum]|uniref:Mitochondrial substrate carrier family protein n=1 Tax=Dictyostelium purpureum TaxID=5786 RepID=F1A4J1_DICPU|nr:uncharacterized protein DICPUDRAFT_85047 [Dictyostelium purpureum]EGC28894.1 hypothetical protein DICPUDRAFT_85047 [Dictyostelium purpureum]|eukprot:XP_003294586.1 hypothetical protein DICPUDRAFT_85047 [Dictyostelium purpureum]